MNACILDFCKGSNCSGFDGPFFSHAQNFADSGVCTQNFNFIYFRNSQKYHSPAGTKGGNPALQR